MEKKDLLLYECPSVAEWISWGLLQEVVARYTAWKINRKWKRYQKRLERAKFFNLIKGDV